MIRVEGLDKHYGTFHAVQDVSFEVAKGEVVGFLGPNGAGKTTTMRILCGCLGATSGRALIDGKDDFRTVFHAHECATARRIVEDSPGVGAAL